MPFELIHTSSPNGIDPNARGFTTVAMSQGLTGIWRSRLESLSSYAVEDGVGGQPVVTRHVLLHIAGSKRHVISRIAPCGLDYTGRPNRIAHHLILEASECPIAGPAWLLQQHQLFQQQWDQPPVVRNSAPQLADANISPAPCSTWQQLTGDAGNAAHLIRHWTSGERKKLMMIVPDGTDVLALFAEATALLDPSDRWRATFATLSQQLPTDAVCAVQTGIAGTRTAKTAIAHPGIQTLDLTALPTCPEDAWTQAARSGTLLPPSRGVVGDVSDKAVIDPRIAAAQAAAAMQAQAEADANYAARGPKQPAGAWPPNGGAPLGLADDPNAGRATPHGRMPVGTQPGASGQSKSNPLPWIISGVALMLLCVVALVLSFTRVPDATDTSAEVVGPSGDTTTPQEGSDPPKETEGDRHDDDSGTTGSSDANNSGTGESSEPTHACVFVDEQRCQELTELECREKDGVHFSKHDMFGPGLKNHTSHTGRPPNSNTYRT